VGLLLADLTKTVRSALTPLFTAIQGGANRVNSWVAAAVSQVPPDRQVPAKPALLNAAVAAIGVEEDDSEMRSYYVKLLASLMDRDREKDVHPAFPRLLQELSPLDAMLFQMMPGPNGARLPDGMGNPTYSLQSVLAQTLEPSQGSGHHDKQQRFFIPTIKLIESSTHLTPTGTPVFRRTEHCGFLEIIPSRQSRS